MNSQYDKLYVTSITSRTIYTANVQFFALKKADNFLRFRKCVQNIL